MPKLLIALDCDFETAMHIYMNSSKFVNHPNFGGFKLSLSSVLTPRNILAECELDEIPFMLDFKLYNMPSEIERDVRLAEKLGTTWLTVHISCVAAAKHNPSSVKIIAVDSLTSNPTTGKTNEMYQIADGLVCHPNSAQFYKPTYPDKSIFCPGIRQGAETIDDHSHPVTVREAVRRGADYLIIGRPIYAAKNPLDILSYTLDEISSSSRGF